MTTPLKVLLDNPLHPLRAFATELAGLMRERERAGDTILGAAIYELLEERCAAFEEELRWKLESEDWTRLREVLAPVDPDDEGPVEPSSEAICHGYVQSAFEKIARPRSEDRSRLLLVLDPDALKRCEAADGRPGAIDQVSLDAVQLAKQLAGDAVVVRRGLARELLDAVGAAIAAQAVRESRSILTSLGPGDDVSVAALCNRMSERGYQVWWVATTAAAESEASVQARGETDQCHYRWLDAALKSLP